jgi:hypothetical protein
MRATGIILCAAVLAMPATAAAEDTKLVLEAATIAVDASTTAEVEDKKTEKTIEPFATIVGGFRYESLQRREGDTQQERSPTVAVSRIGARGRVGEYVTFETEFEANIGGGLGYGASVWEGQAQMSVRNQFVQYSRAGFAAAAGRITDEASIDYYSAHVADLLLTDVYTRDTLLYSGADRGTGIKLGYRINERLRTGLAFHSTNPTGLTGTFLIGGKLFPYDRPFFLAAAQVGRSESTLPDQNLHIYFGTPSLMYEGDLIDAKTAVQLYQLDTQLSTEDDQRIRGYNLRGNVRLKLRDGQIAPFLNVSRNLNEMLDPNDATVKLDDIYEVLTFGGGVDVRLFGDSGIGAQYMQVQQDSNTGSVRDHYINVGGSYWVQEGLSIGLRLAWFVRDDAAQQYTYGHGSVFSTVRLAL